MGMDKSKAHIKHQDSNCVDKNLAISKILK